MPKERDTKFGAEKNNDLRDKKGIVRIEVYHDVSIPLMLKYSYLVRSSIGRLFLLLQNFSLYRNALVHIILLMAMSLDDDERLSK